MAIPKYDEMYREFLLCLSDGEAHKTQISGNMYLQVKG